MRRLVTLCAVVASMNVLTVSDASASDAPAASPLHDTEANIDGGCLRGGIEGLGGAGFATGGVSGPLVGMDLRVGWQFARRVAVCLQGTVFWWDSSKTAISARTTAHGSFGLQLTPRLSLTPSDTIELAAGPLLDLIGTPSSETCSSLPPLRATTGPSTRRPPAACMAASPCSSTRCRR